jgi:aminopeptidase N
MKPQTPRTVRLKDYLPSSHLVETVDLVFELGAQTTRVTSRLAIKVNQGQAPGLGPLVLHGEHFALDRVAIDGRTLPSGAYDQSDEALTIHNPPVRPFVIETVTVLNPSLNKALQGLYLTKGVYCTQCEAEGFRRITYMLDRPDVLARYSVRIVADVQEAPVLLSNGNLIERGTMAGGRHYAVWHDPHPKPTYLFALVAGDLSSIASDFKTMSGRNVDLRIYVEHGKEARAAWAMDSLKRSMRWDEQRFGREYDLEQFNIVAVSDFNMGAMENKGLNVFNDRLILASADTATDAQFEAIESVVAHEYFHNWTGNRITCRDWFQLCLKEGLTVYRDQEFSSDERSRTVQRIVDVRQLKATQFAEDAGPLSHPVRPESYIEINNFYTATVYEKGAELVRMLATILGPSDFRAGMEGYFERHDGKAATVEDFIACFEAASGHDLSQFQLWYSQSGTPELDCRIAYDRKAKTLDLTLSQALPAGKPAGKRRPMPVPVRLGLVGSDGHDLPLTAAGGVEARDGVVVLTKPQQTFRFTGVERRPVVSLLRGFSAPVKLSLDLPNADLAFLAAHDSDLFNRWQSAQHYGLRTLLDIYASLKAGKRSTKGGAFAKTLAAAIGDSALEPAYRAELLRLPSIFDLMQDIDRDVDPALAAKAHRLLTRRIATTLGDDLERLYKSMRRPGPFSPDAASAGQRALRNTVLSLLTARGTDKDLKRLRDHYFSATNMTDQAHALTLLARQNIKARTEALEHFENRWRGDDLVMDIWFSARAQSTLPGALDDVKALLAHPGFKITTPNKVRALIGTFASANSVHFHRPDGAGYTFVADQVLAIDRFNPQVASRLLSSLRSWRTLEPGRRDLARRTLTRIAATPELSRDVHEIVSKMAEGA